MASSWFLFTQLYPSKFCPCFSLTNPTSDSLLFQSSYFLLSTCQILLFLGTYSLVLSQSSADLGYFSLIVFSCKPRHAKSSPNTPTVTLSLKRGLLFDTNHFRFFFALMHVRHQSHFYLPTSPLPLRRSSCS